MLSILETVNEEKTNMIHIFNRAGLLITSILEELPKVRDDLDRAKNLI